MKKSTLNINRRDRNLLLFLLAAVLFYLCYTWVMLPAWEKADELAIMIEDTKAELAAAEAMTQQTVELGTQRDTLKTEVLKKYDVFFPTLVQADILHGVDALIEQAGIYVTAYIPSPTEAARVPVETVSPKVLNYPLLELAGKVQKAEIAEEPVPVDESAAEETAADAIPRMDVALEFTAPSYEHFYQFLKATEDLDKSVQCENIEIETQDVSGIAGKVTFSFYALPSLDEAAKSGFEFTPVAPKGKVDPFH